MMDNINEGPFNPEMLITARQFKALSQKELSQLSGVPQGSVSKYEKGGLRPTEENLQKIALSLGFRQDFFYQTANMVPPITALHRKQASLGVKNREQIEAGANIQRVHFQKLYSLSPWTIKFNKLLEASPIKAARMLRKQLNLPPGPIENMTELVQELGILVVTKDFGNLALDGFAFVCESVNDVPSIFINVNRPTDRQRLNLAHELGHLVLHEPTSKDVESEAWEFACEFLMPSQEIVGELKQCGTSLFAYEKLKRKWKVSMQALIRRAKDLNVIKEPQYRYMMIQMTPYRKKEPVQLLQEKATFLKETLEEIKGKIGDQSLCDFFMISQQNFNVLYRTVI